MSTPASPESDPDVQLMLAVQRGDNAAFETLFRKYISSVVGFARRFVGNRSRAEELAQDVFLRLYQTRERYVPAARFATWLYRMVTNACLSETRRGDYRARPVALRTEAPATDEPTVEIATASSEDVVADTEAVRRARDVIALLPPQQRAALLLARVEGLSYEEVALSLDCSVSAVKSLVHRATVTLREKLGERD